jgi:hypothetical protein
MMHSCEEAHYIFDCPRAHSLSANSVGSFADQVDVGNPLRTGHATYDAANDEYTIEGAGANIWANRDEFHFVWRN